MCMYACVKQFLPGIVAVRALGRKEGFLPPDDGRVSVTL